MLIKGFQKTTLLDFPGRVAATVFTCGCNFRCPFCHNASLVTHIDSDDMFSEAEIFSYLKKRKGILDGVCITGGEPLLQKDIAEFCRKIKEIDLEVKLDTNGSFPYALQTLIEEGLVDYVAMDIKNCKEHYAETCGITEMPKGIEESISILKASAVPFEFRTTVTKEFHDEYRLSALAAWIGDVPRYFLQCFTDSGDLIEEGLSAYTEAEMHQLLNAVRIYTPNAQLRGI